MKRILAGIPFIILTSFFPSWAQTTEEVIGNYLNAIGGLDRLNKIESKIDESLFIKYAPNDPLAFNFNPNDSLKVNAG